ncbi:MAG: PIN domain-containing protein [Calditrichaeota bacterium]|nr:MAG: PIN domain-containing protein [Calditrichota bacterium]
MSDKFFLDTNILIYSFDSTSPDKQRVAQNLIGAALGTSGGCISYQVIQEYLNVATQKFQTPLTINDCKNYLTKVLEPLCETFPSVELFHAALEIKEGWHYSFYDSLIVSAALMANCTILYSEDLQHEQHIKNLQILNPFVLF